MEQRELTLAPESVGLRLDRWLAEQCPDCLLYNSPSPRDA